MKTTILLSFTMLYTVNVSFSQKNKIRDEEQKVNWQYFKDYDDPTKSFIKEHWKQYFKGDIYSRLSPSIDLFPVKLDSYGSLYPANDIFKNFEESDFNPNRRNDKDNIKFSMYDIFTNRKLEKNIDLMVNESEKEFYKKMIQIRKSSKKDSLFYKLWDEYHLSKISNALNDKIREKEQQCHKKVKVLFFVHGYNVPYSLANIQVIQLVELLKEENVDISNILFVPVFWPSNNAKHCNLENEDKFTTKNFSTIRDGGLKNGTSFWYYSNRAYYAGIGLRKIINKLPEKTEILIFSHSLGTTSSTTALINTYSKIDTDFKIERDSSKSAEQFLLATGERLKKEPLNYDLITTMLEEPIPTKQIRVFLSAAAIPGQSTFCDIDTLIGKLYSWYLPVDIKDEMLNKAVVPLGRADRFGNTCLGINYENDASLTQKNLRGFTNFNIELDASENIDHDILTYMRQPKYRKYIVRFIEGN